MRALLCLSFALSVFSVSAAPTRPAEAIHPGSDSYSFESKHETKQFLGRTVNVYLPVDSSGQTPLVPVIVKSYFFGGRDGVAALHFYGAWKWLLGGAWDIQSGHAMSNPYLYGTEADSTGDPNLKHILTRSW